MANWQPLVGSQLSSVHGLPSVHVMAAPALQVPATQASLPVQTLPSVQMALLAAWTQAPVTALQESSVQTLPSSQATAAPGTQLPPLHLSPLVQPLLSVQTAVLLLWAHPLILLQESSVHGLPSSQLTAAPAPQLPFLQVSPTVQTSPSLHGAVLLACAQPLAAPHESSVHGLLSSQPTAAPGTHLPAAHLSPLVHALLSVQTAVLLA